MCFTSYEPRELGEISSPMSPKSSASVGLPWISMISLKRVQRLHIRAPCVAILIDAPGAVSLEHYIRVYIV